MSTKPRTLKIKTKKSEQVSMQTPVQIVSEQPPVPSMQMQEPAMQMQEPAMQMQEPAMKVKEPKASISMFEPSMKELVPVPAMPAKSATPVPVSATVKLPTERKNASAATLKKNSPTTAAVKESNAGLFALLDLYLSNITKDSPTEQLELEVKFGTMTGGYGNGNKSITQINYDNIIKKLLAVGFTIDQNISLLRIQNEYLDPKTGSTHLSSIRTEISGLQNIRKYCQTNNINTIENGVSFLQKNRFGDMNNVDKPDFNFRISLNKEINLNKNMPMVRALVDKWNDNKKTFRYLNRVKLTHKNLPVIVDLSIVKESKRQGRYYVTEYSVHDSDVFNAPERYEVEIECVNKDVGLGSPWDNSKNLWNGLLNKTIKYILTGIQETNYPISYSEQRMILQFYMVLIWGKEYNENMRIKSSNFVGPSSNTLEMKHIQPMNTDSVSPNIRENFTVTDKADGERKLLFISPEGRIYLINTNMDVQFTGTITNVKETWNTLLDGEHILYDKHKKFINLYAAFDIYYIAGEDVRAKGFVPIVAEEEANKYRLPLLETLVGRLAAVSVVNPANPVPLKITKKRFYLGTAVQSIFQGCSFILAKEHDGLFEYETDGLIFTPANRGVGSDKIGEYIKPYKSTWDYSFKWKPPQFNTIDFLVSVKKNANGTDFIGNIFNSGTDMSSALQINEYKTVVLCVGFDQSKHGFINPYQDTIDDKVPKVDNLEYKDKYVPMQFYPTEPSDYKAGICNLMVRDAEKHMFTEANEIIEDNMIIEFSYDMKKDEQWRWVPLRIRYDKTAQLRAGEPNYGNAFHVANNNWHSIHNPISQTMIMTGDGIPAELGDDDVYYNKVAGASKTRALRDFHNLYVKSLLIGSVAKPGNTLIDLAVGKGGDFPKWIDAKLKFVFGVDISRDNIQNRMNGAYARYLNYRKQYRVMPAALFVNGNSSVNIRKTTGILVDKDKQITKAVFGQGPKDVKSLGQGVYNQYGVGSEGFDVCSIQFAIHYMFENQETLHNFLQNVSEVTKEGGYFIGTSYDGERIFNMLKNVQENESKVIMGGNEATGDLKKIWEVTKRYDRAEFNDDETCLGYAIDVFQETINKTFREYLVNYSYLTRVLENYGFVLVSKEELEKLHSPFTQGTALFTDLFNKMNDDIKKNPRLKASYGEAPTMSDGERTISFLNRYFIYKKVRKVSDVDKVSLNLQHKTASEVSIELDESQTAKQAVTKALTEKTTKPRVKLSIIKKKQPTAAPLSTIMEVNTEASAQTLQVPDEPANANVSASLGPASLGPASLGPASLGKAPVTKLKRVLKLKK